jgi:signal transduction histidine kinase
MNPTSTLRFRRITGALAAGWALLALFFITKPVFSPHRGIRVPISVSLVAGIPIVQAFDDHARALGVGRGDRLLAVDGVDYRHIARRDVDFLTAERPNLYLLEKPDGRRLSVALLPETMAGAGADPVRNLFLAGVALVGLCYFFAGGVVWRMKADRAEAWALLLFCSLMASMLFSSVRVGGGSGYSYLRSEITTPLLGASIFHLFTTYPIEPAWIVRRRRLRGVPYAVALAIGATSLLAERIGLPLGLLPMISFCVVTASGFLCLGILAVERRRLPDGPFADRADVMLLGALVSFAPLLTIGVLEIVFRLSFPASIGLAGLLAFPVAVGYGIVRKQLFDIRMVARSSVAFGAASAAVVGLYASIIISADALLRGVNSRSPWFSFGALFLVILASKPLFDRLQATVNGFFDRDRAAYRRAVREISEAMVSMLSIKEIVDRILVALTDTMGVDRAMVLLLDETDRRLRPAASRGEWENDALETQISADHPIWRQLWMRREELSRADFDDEPDPETREACRDVFDTLEIELLVPILFGVDLLGVIAVGRKLTGERLAADDRQLLRTLANQSAIAIENAKAYDEITQLNETLEARVEERTEELKRAQEQLMQSEKMRSLGQLVAGVAHELNNPIGFVHANLQLLEEYVQRLIHKGPDGPEGEKTREAIRKLLLRSREGTQRVKRIVEDLRTFSRMDHAEYQEADLNEEIERTLSLMEPRLKGGVRVVRDFGELPRVRCSAGQMNQVFMNLLMNACDAMGNQGTITIRTETIRSPLASGHGGSGEPAARGAATGVRLSFSDDGPGIPDHVRGRIFEPFFTTKPVGEGTGLGLSLSHGIIERHGGRISVESVTGSGTTFTIELPLVAREFTVEMGPALAAAPVRMS